MCELLVKEEDSKFRLLSQACGMTGSSVVGDESSFDEKMDRDRAFDALIHAILVKI
jgi:hypothetical protein